ncbi:MAG: hypothetical protein ACRCYP_01135 [Alphaproteobacteria bacterium]
MKKFALKGINDDTDSCSCCGRSGLKRVMWVVELNSNSEECSEAFHLGTSCGAKFLGFKQSKVNTKIKNFDSEVQQKRYKLLISHPAHKKAEDLRNQIYLLEKKMGKRMSYSDRQKHPLQLQIDVLEQQAREWVNTQNIFIEL